VNCLLWIKIRNTTLSLSLSVSLSIYIYLYLHLISLCLISLSFDPNAAQANPRHRNSLGHDQQIDSSYCCAWASRRHISEIPALGNLTGSANPALGPGPCFGHAVCLSLVLLCTVSCHWIPDYEALMFSRHQWFCLFPSSIFLFFAALINIPNTLCSSPPRTAHHHTDQTGKSRWLSHSPLFPFQPNPDLT
jgi:hypothetical protein